MHISDEELVTLIEQVGQREASRRTGIPRSTLQDRYNRILREQEIDDTVSDDLPRGMKIGASGRRVPLSENERKLHLDWTAEDCISHLRQLAEENPEQYITRNWFRNNSDISESTWTSKFGTFSEFKRQAEITPSRHVRRHELHIAKHAASDRYRAMNIEKASYEGLYLRPSGNRYQTIISAGDIHDRNCDPFWRHCFIDTVRRVQPDKIIFNGDLIDLPEFGKYTVDPRNWDVVGRIRWLHGFLAEVREAAPDAEIVYLEANHEARLLKHLAEATPAMRAVLADLHGFTVSKLLGLDDYEVNYVARVDLAAYTQADLKAELHKNYHVAYDCFLTHHYPEGRNMGLPGVNGHHHKHVVTPFYSPLYGSTEWHQLGCGHARAAEYCAAEKWGLGFCISHVDTQRRHVQFEYVELRDHAVIGGKWYMREECV